MANILTLATAGLKADQQKDKEHKNYPRVDYIELQRFLDTDILDYTIYGRTRLGNFFRSIETQVHSDLYLTMLGLLRRKSYRLVFAMSERAGIPFSALNKLLPGSRHFVAMFTCWSERQERLIKALNLFGTMDAIAVHCQSMRDHFLSLGACEDKVQIVPYSIDHRFFSPMPEVTQEQNLIVSVGEIRSRDYKSLFEAVDGLPLNLSTAASGLWYAREKDTTLPIALPDNAKITGRLTQAELRTLYARSQFVVLPVYDVLYSAGATGALEAACMARPVIAFKSRGIVDYVIDGETGILVPPGDVKGLREAIAYLLAHPEEAQKLGRNARQRIEEELNLDLYVSRIAQLLETFL